MQARYPENYTYPNEKPARYTDDKTSAYFTQSGITQLGYIRAQLETLQAQATTSDTTKTCITQLIALIDGLADKSMGSSFTVGKRLKTLDEDLMKIFPIEKGAIVFEDIALLEAASIITQGIGAIEPDDLNPPKALLVTMGKSNFELCGVIKSTMDTINAQINFLIQLKKNAEASEALYELMGNILNITHNFSSIIFKDNIIIDQQQNNGQGKKIEPREVIQRVNDAITDMNALIQQYTNSECSSITLKTMGARLAPKATFELMLSSGCHLEHIKRDGYNIPNKAQQISPVFMTTSVPFEALKLACALKNLVDSTQSHLKIQPDNTSTQREIEETTDRLTNMMTSLQGAIVRKAGNATLKENMKHFKEALTQQLNGYIESTMEKNSKKEVENNKKLEIASNLISDINKVNLQIDFTPNDQFAEYISTVAKAYYDHNHHCTIDGKSPGNLGKILVDAMSHLAALSEKIVANDSAYHENNINTINQLLTTQPENTRTNRP